MQHSLGRPDQLIRIIAGAVHARRATSPKDEAGMTFLNVPINGL
jgi:hypothetical protein